jgi:hypothetical protein
MGWWLAPVVLILLALLLRVMVRKVSRFRQKRRLRQQALRELDVIAREFDASRDAAGSLEKVSTLLRRVAITVYPDPGLPGCIGQAWADWLRRTDAGKQDPEVFEALTRAPYQRAPEIEMQRVLKAVEQWIRAATHPYRAAGRAT